jgi:succinoglycan biosynthesis transport protein ExoP
MPAIDIARAIVARWFVVVLGVVLGVGAAAALTATITPTYASTTEVFVAVRSQSESSATEIATGSNAAQQKLTTYKDLVTTPRVLAPVIEELDLDTTPVRLADQVAASATTSSVILTITATATDRATAAAIADAVTDSLVTVVTTQLEPEVSPGVPSVTLELVTPAVEAASASSPHTRANLALGAASGAFAAAAAVLLLKALDTKVRGRDDLPQGIELPVVGEIAFDAQMPRRPLIVRDDGTSPHAESFRTLRTNIQYLDTDHVAGALTIGVTSSTASEGKTTTTANLAIALADSGLRVVVVDADLRRPALATVLGLEGAVGLSDLLIGKVELDDVAQPWGRDELTVVPSGFIPPNPSELLSSKAMETLLSTLGDTYDVIVIDTPPLLSVTDAALIARLVDTMLLVVATGRTRREDVRRAVDRLTAVGTRPRGAILTMTRHRRGTDPYYRYVPNEQRPAAPALRRLSFLPARST